MAVELVESERAAISDYFAARQDVHIAYLFGSHARGRPVDGSDVDIGIVPASTMASEAPLVMGADLATMLDRDVDIVRMDTAPIELQFAIIGARVPLYAHDHEARIDYEVRTMGLYADAEPQLQRQFAQIRKGPDREQRRRRSRALAELHRDAARATDRLIHTRTK